MTMICPAEKLSGKDFGQLTEVTQSVNVQKQKLEQLMSIVDDLLDGKGTDKWSASCKFTFSRFLIKSISFFQSTGFKSLQSVLCINH